MKKNDNIIPYDSPEAASRKTVTGWVSRRGVFYGDLEGTARYDGCTHRPCETCGSLTPKGYLLCTICRSLKVESHYASAPKAPWDGTGFLYSERLEVYTAAPEEFLETANEGGEITLTMADLRLYLCEPKLCHEIDPNDYYYDLLPEDGEVPNAVQTAFDELNAKLRAITEPCSWWHTDTAWDLTITKESQP